MRELSDNDVQNIFDFIKKKTPTFVLNYYIIEMVHEVHLTN